MIYSADRFLFFPCSDNVDLNSVLENSLSAKEKIISELNMELHKIETTLSSEREQHLIEIKNLNASINEKVTTNLSSTSKIDS